VPTAAPARMMFPLTPPKQINPQISDRLNQAILQGMELQPENRPQSIGEWFGLLGLAYQGKSVKIYSQSQRKQLSPKTKPKSSVVTTPVIKPQLQKNSLPWIITISSVGSLLFVMGLVVTQSAHIPIICKPLNNCAVDEKFSSQYQQVKDIAVAAQNLFESAKNVEELRASQEQVQDAIAQLKTIPTSAKIYNTARKELSDYQSQLTKIQRRLDKENQAIDSINQAKQQAQDAEKQMGKAQTVSEYEAVKEKLQQAIATLNDIPSDTFISERVTNLKESYQSKREEVDAKIPEVKPTPTPSPTSTPTPNPTPSPTNYPDPRDPLPFPANDIKSPQWSYEVFNSNSDSGSSRLIGKPNFDQQKREVEWLVEYSTISRSNNETSPKSSLDKTLVRINKDLDLLLVQQEIEGIGFFAEFKDSNGVSLGKAKLNREGTGNRIRYSLRISDNIWQKWSEISQVIITK
ncbi:MAG: hypothetical protein ACKPFA_26030, partial [Dolichospermum sp.]